MIAWSDLDKLDGTALGNQIAQSTRHAVQLSPMRGDGFEDERQACAL